MSAISLLLHVLSFRVRPNRPDTTALFLLKMPRGCVVQWVVQRLGKENAIKVDRVKDGIHEVIVYCKGHKDKTIIQAIDIMLKAQK